VAQVRRLAPDAACWLLTETWGPDVLQLAADLRVGGVCLDVRLASEAALGQLRAAGLPVIIWTADQPARIHELLHAGVAGIITNLPRVGVSVRAEWEAERGG
ncbi:MAG TPA: glycerophosphodiester phosphodiesterase family protein, partial [Longimicrobium sp.]|nr:glycerophosphodiester phosphodiesterase family protein [Longimicrobium sp.]